MGRVLSLILAVFGVAGWASGAAAAVITKGPTSGTAVFGYYGANPDVAFGYGKWSEAIGSNPPYGTSQLQIDRTSSGTQIRITTPFDIATGDGIAQAADFAISTHANGVYDLGIALGKQTEALGLYAVSNWQTSRDIWTGQTGFVYGGEWTNDQACRGSTDPHCGGARDTPTRITAGTLLSNHVSIAQTGNLVTIDIADLALDYVSVLWGTADCSNDPIGGNLQVPEPTSLAGFAVGLLCLGVAARRSGGPARMTALPAA